MSEEIIQGRDWTGADLDLVVGDYCVMLGKEIAGKTADRAAHQRALRFVSGRSGAVIEWKQCEISAAFTLIGLPILQDFQPRWNLADDLLDAVDRQLTSKPALITAALRPPSLFSPAGSPLPVEGPPPLFNDEQANPNPRAARLIARFDPGGRDQADRFLTETGLAFILASEQRRLRDHGRHDLADQVRPAAYPVDPRGCGLISFKPTGELRRIAVKATTGGVATPFHLTPDEDALWRADPAFRIRRLYDLGREPRFYTLRPPRDAEGEQNAEAG